jgi:Phosphate-selective porin O and P
MTISKRFCLASILVLALAGPAAAQAPDYPSVTVGVVSFLQYSYDFQDVNNFNAFSVPRGFLNVEGKLSPHVRFRFTPDVQPTTDATLTTNLTMRLAYASLEADYSDRTSILFGMHETPWLTFEQSINRYRVQGPMFAERENLIPGETDLGVSVRVKGERTEVHAGIYNGEGSGRQEVDQYKSAQGRVTYRPFADDSPVKSLRFSGFYSYGFYAKDRPRRVGIVMASYEELHVVATGQYLFATDNPFVATDLKRSGTSFFGEVRQGLTGWAGLASMDFFDPDSTVETDARRRYIFGGAHWSQWGRGRVGFVVTLQQVFHTLNATTSERLESKLLAQTHVEF